MAFGHPYGWWTWVFVAGAIVLPYIAVVFANAGRDSTAVATAESPTQQLTASRPVVPAPAAESPSIITIEEKRDDER